MGVSQISDKKKGFSLEILNEIRIAEERLKDQSKLLKDMIPVIDFHQIGIGNNTTENIYVYKTTKRNIHSLQYGSLILRKTFYYNNTDFYEKFNSNNIESQPFGQLARIVSGKKHFSFDVMCLIGQLRFTHDHSREQIQKTLKQTYNLTISTGSISNYSIEFLVRFYLYHTKNFELLVHSIVKSGGYILGADGSGQGGSKRILLLMDLLKGWTLKAEAISSEKSDLIIPLFENLVKTTGKPLAYVRDMGKGLRKAGENVFPDIPTRECNFHFLRDVGKDIMLINYQNFKKLLVNLKIKSKLNNLRKFLKEEADMLNLDIKKVILKLKAQTSLIRIPIEHILLSEIYHLISWILNYSEDTNGLRFPYSLPWVLLYHRCRSALEIYTEIKLFTAKLKQKPVYCYQLDSIFHCLFSDENASKIVLLEKSLMKCSNYFSELRKILRLSDIKGDIPRDQLILSNNEIIDVEQELIKFKIELEMKAEINSLTNINTEKIILKHLKHHWKYLLVPNIDLLIEGKKKSISIPRAISLADSRFGKIKTSIRKRTGRTQINYDLDRYGVFLCYLENLHSAEYVKVLFGNIENLPKFLSNIPSSEVKNFLTDFNSSQLNYDISRARGNDEYENFLNATSSLNTELYIDLLVK